MLFLGDFFFKCMNWLHYFMLHIVCVCVCMQQRLMFCVLYDGRSHVVPAETAPHADPLPAAPYLTAAQLWGAPWWRWLWPRRRRTKLGSEPGPESWLGGWQRRPGLQARPEQQPQCREGSWGGCSRSHRRGNDRVCTQPSWVRLRWLWRVRDGLWRGLWRRLWRGLWKGLRLSTRRICQWARGLRRHGVLLQRCVQQPCLQQHHHHHHLPDVLAHGPLDSQHLELQPTWWIPYYAKSLQDTAIKMPHFCDINQCLIWFILWRST